MDTIELTIEKVVHGGDGIGRVGKTVVFVPFSAPGDHLKVRVLARKHNYWQARIEEVITPSPLRTPPPCPYFGTCGGCDLQHLSYEAQLVTKKLSVNESLQRIGKVFIPPGNPLTAGEPWRYRNKSQYQVFGPPWRVGYYARGSHWVVDTDGCLIQPEEFDRLRSTLAQSLAGSAEKSYREADRDGNLRHIALARGMRTGETVLVYVTTGTELAPEVYRGIEKSNPLLSIVHNTNPAATNRILGDRFKTLSGSGRYHEQLLDRRLRVSPGSFFQANTAVTELLVKRVLKYLDPDGAKTVLDLYSGVGTIAVPVAGFVGRVIAIENNRSAVEDARANADENGCANLQVIEGEAEVALSRVSRADSVILDPPRKGCSPGVLNGIAALKPREIVYVSCNPTTLARDLALLRESGYEPTDVQPIDMFPQTSHIETIVRLVRADAPQRVKDSPH